MALPRGAMGLSAVCHCGISRSYSLTFSLGERVVVDGHGCHTALYFSVKTKENKEKFLRCAGYLNYIRTKNI